MKQSQNNIENKISWEDIKEYILDRQPYDYKAKPVKMDDVILIDNNAYIKETIIEWLDEVRNSDKLKDYNILPTKTLFLTGAPGLGKTYMAKAVATELKWPMYIIDVAGVMKQNGLDALIKIFSFVRDPQNQPCILFLDECDGVARSREEKGSSADKAGDNRITNYIMQVLQEENDNIDSQLIIFAATNFPEGIDEAFLNRFQIQLMYYLPEDYVPFIKLEMKKNKMFTLVEDVDPELIKSINIEANNAKFSIRALNAKILWIYKQTLLQKIKNHDLHGEVIEIKLSTIMQSIANDIKFGIDINKIQDDEKKLKDDFKDVVENASETEEKEI